MATTIYLLYYVVQKTSFEITFKFLYGLMYGIKEAIQPYMSYVWFPWNIYGGHPWWLCNYCIYSLKKRLNQLIEVTILLTFFKTRPVEAK